MTITAKNYSAQAEKGLEDYAKFLVGKGRIYDARKTRELPSLIKKSVKFTIPNNGVIFDDGFKGLMGNVRLSLPFDNCSIEYHLDRVVSNDDILIKESEDKENGGIHSRMVVRKKLLILSQDDEHITFFSVFFAEKYNLWKTQPFFGKIKREKIGDSIEFEAVHFFDEVLCRTQGNYFIDSCVSTLHKDGESILELLEALSCTNVEISIHQPASPKNAQRIKSHKLPIYETKVLTIKAGKESLSNSDSSIKDNHASPRQHLRRGHIRRLESGNIWVNSCVVGSKENGVIDKQYKVVK